MTKNRWLVAASAFSILTLAACEMSKTPEGGDASVQGEAKVSGLSKLARIEMTTDTSYLTGEEREVVNLLIQASDLMSEIYKRQTTPNYDQLRAEVVAKNDPQLLERFDAFFGPWDPINDGEAFFGGKPKPPGAGFYPTDLTKEEFDKYLAAHPDEAAKLTDPYTVVKRQGDKLVAVPYSVEYKQWLEPAAKLLEQAAAKTSNPSLKTFLTLKDPKESAALDRYKGELRGMEANLPVEERYKNFQRGFESPIAVADQIQGGGDNVPGVQTVAFNLPNDERVREAKGAKKVILRNVLGAKYERILAPMASLTLVPEQAGDVTKNYMFMETLFHELSHSLGPGSIVVNGRQTTVDKELKDIASGFEEAKADVMGAWNILYMMDKGLLPAAEKKQIRATYVAGLFRAMRFGTGEAHGKGAAMQYRFIRDRGGIVWDPQAKRFRVDEAKIDGAIRDLVGAIVRLQGNGDYAGTKAFLDKWAVVDPEAQQVIDTMKDIPVDIRPIYPDHI